MAFTPRMALTEQVALCGQTRLSARGRCSPGGVVQSAVRLTGVCGEVGGNQCVKAGVRYRNDVEQGLL